MINIPFPNDCINGKTPRSHLFTYNVGTEDTRGKVADTYYANLTMIQSLLHFNTYNEYPQTQHKQALKNPEPQSQEDEERQQRRRFSKQAGRLSSFSSSGSYGAVLILPFKLILTFVKDLIISYTSVMK
ncbi:hypothetical protein NC651_000782 [Populus alba x Populus x berolinensis]|nr:hypothetical protein NC651_000782 [Populus alba x Populus x berolinensis]